MDFSTHIDPFNMGLPIVQGVTCLNNHVFLSLKVVLVLADSADPDEM